MRRQSSNSAGATYLDSAERIQEIRRAALNARNRIPTIQRIVLFGSLVTGNATPRSDADILVVVEQSNHEQPRDRVPEFLKAFSPLPCPIDLFVLTSAEVERYRTEGSPLLRVALGTGIDLI